MQKPVVAMGVMELLAQQGLDIVTMAVHIDILFVILNYLINQATMGVHIDILFVTLYYLINQAIRQGSQQEGCNGE